MRLNPGNGRGSPGSPLSRVTCPCPQWPYCEKRCSYCNFNKYIPRGVDEAALRRCLVTEAQTLLRLSGVRRWVLGAGSWELCRAAEQVAGILEGSPTSSSPFSFPRVESVFFGGGTPSLASPHTVAAVEHEIFKQRLKQYLALGKPYICFVKYKVYMFNLLFKPCIN